MKKKLIILLLLFTLFIVFLTVRFFFLTTQNTFGKLRVISSPSSTIFINNVAVGKTPYEEKLKAGEYLLKLIPEGTATQTASWQSKIKVYKNTLSYVNRSLGPSDLSSSGEIFTVTKVEKTKKPNYGEVYVETEPSGSIVYLDNDEKGVASMILADVVRGDHELSVFMPGFLRRTEKIKIDSGYRVNAYFKLAIDPSQQPKEEEQKQESTDSAKVKKKKVVIEDTPTGFLRVREEPSISASESARVNPGEKYDYVEEQEGWYKIQLDKDTQGWVYSQYATKEE